MRDGRVAKQHRHFGNAESFIVQEVFGVFHALALVKIENGGAENLLEPFFKVTFIDGNLAAERFDGDGFADMFQQDLPGHDDLFPVGFICQELAGKCRFGFFSKHAIHAVQQQDLCLCIDEDIFQCIGIGMVQ